MRNKVLVVNGRPEIYTPIGTAMERFSDGVEVGALRLDESSGLEDHVIQWLRAPYGSGKDSFGPIVIPRDRFLMLGDNRDDSADSRYFGLVPRPLLIGRAVAVLVSADITGNWAPRFGRFGERLK